MVAEHHTAVLEEHGPFFLVVICLDTVHGIVDPLVEQVCRPSLDEAVGKLALPALVLNCGIQEVQGTQDPEEALRGVALFGCHAQSFGDDHLVDSLFRSVFVLAVDSLHHLLLQFVFHCQFRFGSTPPNGCLK